MQGYRCMKHFKHLKRGMSLIEVIAAIAILAIFGTSLFLMQQFLFDRMMITQHKLIATLNMQTELVAYQKNILKELFDPQGAGDKILQDHVKEFNNPNMTVKINVHSDVTAQQEDKESPFKNFKNLYLITCKAEHDTKEYAKFYMFVYIPEVAKK